MPVGESLSVILQEYSVLRAEQGRRFDAIDRMTNYILVMMLGISGVAVTLSREKVSEVIALTAVVCLPIFFSPLIFGYLYNELMIFRIGRYVHSVLAKEIGMETEGRLLGWDEFNVKETVRLFPLITAFFRNLILILPVVVPLLVSLTVFSRRPRWANILVGIDFVVLLAIVAVIVYKAVYFVHVVNQDEERKGG